MVQRGGTLRMNVENVTLIVSVVTLIMVSCVLFKTCVTENFVHTPEHPPAASLAGANSRYNSSRYPDPSPPQ